MSDLYRIDDDALAFVHDLRGNGRAIIRGLIGAGVLMEVELCVHGRTEGHYVNGTILPADDAWCPGGGRR